MSEIDVKSIKAHVSEHKGAVKQLDRNRVGGLLVAWGGPNDKDLDGDYFTIDTNFELNWYSQRPCLYDHGTDGEIKTSAIGYIDKIEIIDSMGLWAEAQMRKMEYYDDHIRDWIQQGLIGWSSGSVPQGVEIDKDGFIRRWPIVEGSLTLTPAQPLKTGVMPIKKYVDKDVLVKAVKSIGLESFKVDKFMVDFGKSVDVDNSKKDERLYVEADEFAEATTKEVLIPTERPIQLTINMYQDKNNNNKEFNMPEKITPGAEEELTPTPEPQKTEQVPTPEDAPAPEPQKTEPAPVPNPAPAPRQEESDPAPIPAPTKVQEEPVGVSDFYFRNQVIERMFAKSVSLTDQEIDEFARQLRLYVCHKVYSNNPTEEQASYARYDNDYQKKLNDLIDNAVAAKQPQVVPEDNSYYRENEIAVLRAKLEQFESMIGKGGASMFPKADGDFSNQAQWGGGFIMDADIKNNLGGYGPADLMTYLQMREHITKSGVNEKPFKEEERDALYNIIYNETKELRTNPKFKMLMANRDWIELDYEQAGIRAYKMFDAMDARKGKWFKADEVNNAALTHGGAEWLWTFPDAMLWMTILEEHDLISTIQSFNMVAEKVDWYIDDDLGMPQVIPEVRDQSQIAIGGQYPVESLGTQKVTFTARHMGEQVQFSRILLEDSRVDVAASARSRIEESVARGMVWAILNADQNSDGTGNLTNYGHYGVDAAPTSGTLANQLHNIGFQGLIARALHPAGSSHPGVVVGQEAGLRAGSQNCVSLMRQAYRMMNERYYANPERLCMVMRPSRQNKLWDLEEYRSAISNVGRWDGGNKIMSFDGIPLKISEQVVARDANGRIHSTAANNTEDSVVFYRPDRMRIGIRRAMSTLMRIDGAWNEHFHYGKSLRWDFGIIPSNETSSQRDDFTIRKPVAVLYGLTDTED